VAQVVQLEVTLISQTRPEVIVVRSIGDRTFNRTNQPKQHIRAPQLAMDVIQTQQAPNVRSRKGRGKLMNQ
jgi:hypothetical protein